VLLDSTTRFYLTPAGVAVLAELDATAADAEDDEQIPEEIDAWLAEVGLAEPEEVPA
jgi:hypothetical protein